MRGDFGTEFVTKLVPVSGKIRDQICVAKSKIYGELPPYFPMLPHSGLRSELSD